MNVPAGITVTLGKPRSVENDLISVSAVVRDAKDNAVDQAIYEFKLGNVAYQLISEPTPDIMYVLFPLLPATPFSPLYTSNVDVVLSE